jgi:osmotically-inducible protein OsmY
VQRVEDRIVADPDLEIAVARALADDPKTAGVPAGSVLVFAQLGNVVLVGDLPESLLAEVLRVAGQVPGVRRVVDRLDQA